MYILKKRKELPKYIFNQSERRYIDRDEFLSKFVLRCMLNDRIAFQNKVPVVRDYPEAFEEVKNYE
jgi:hypothetical protein